MATVKASTFQPGPVLNAHEKTPSDDTEAFLEEKLFDRSRLLYSRLYQPPNWAPGKLRFDLAPTLCYHDGEWRKLQCSGAWTDIHAQCPMSMT